MVKIKKILILFTMFVFGLSTSANAGLVIEPYAGYALAGKLDLASTVPLEGSYSGLHFGGRLGVSYLGLMAGGTYNMAMEYTNDLVDASGATGTDKLTRSDYGAFVGFKFPILVSVWGSYYLDSKIEGQETTNGFISYVRRQDLLRELIKNGVGHLEEVI
jgi:hypothetical protein